MAPPPTRAQRTPLTLDDGMMIWRARDAYRLQGCLYALVGFVVLIFVANTWARAGWPWALVVLLGWVVALKILGWGLRWARWGLWWCVDRATLAVTHWWHNRS